MVAILVIPPRMLSVSTTFVRVTLPQLETTPLMVWIEPTTIGPVHSLVTVMQGFSVTTQVLLAFAETGVPQVLRPVAVTVSGKLPQVFVTDFVRVADPPGASEAILPTVP